MRIATTSRFIGRLFAFTAAVAWCGGCSLLFHADAQQCTTTQDCVARNFANTMCVAGACVSVLSSLDSGTESGKSDAGDAGNPDVDAGTPCKSYSDCEDFAQPPYVSGCDPDTLTCVQLTTAECPYVLGDYTESMHTPPIFVGAFAYFPSTSPMSDPSFQNYQLAIDEFTTAGGIPTGPSNGSGYRMPVAVICNVSAPDPTAPMQNLQNAHVRSVVAALDSATLATMFTDYGAGTAANLFFINPYAADTNLTGLTEGNQLWSMLGDPSDLAPAYVAIMPRIENYVRTKAPWSLGPTAPLKVAIVTGQATVLNDLSGSVQTSGISWNNGAGSPTIGNAATFQSYAIMMSSLNGQDPTISTYSSMFTTIENNLIAFQPHVIISFGADEFVWLLTQLDAMWPNNTPPFYLLGPYNAGDQNVVNWIGPQSTLPSQQAEIARVAGINYASPTSSVLTPYQARFVSQFMPDGGSASASANESNYYDAMYFAIDSLIGAGKPPFLGNHVGNGMGQLILASGAACDMGPGDAGFMCVNMALDNTTTGVSLLGTLGPAIFNPKTNARVSQGDVYCMMGVSGQEAYFDYDVLRLGPNPEGGGQVLAGTLPFCYGGF
jgi:hypothetical protein